MSLENLLYQYRSSYTTVYSLGYDWKRKPEDIVPKIHENIKLALQRLNGDGDFVAKFSFRIPDQSHVLPLFQNALFTNLVDFHNTHSDEKGYIHPYTIMLFDPNLSNLRKDIESKKGTFNLHGEDAAQHELAHFLALQERWKTETKGEVEFVLQWEKIKKSYSLTVEGGFIPDETANVDDQIHFNNGPLFPSSVDQKYIRNFLLSSINLKKILALITFNLNKLADQGSTSFNIFHSKPMNTEEMLHALFIEWKSTRKTLINFKIWENLIK